MKNIIRTLLAASLALTAIGCDQDQIATKFDPSAEAANTAYFVQKAILQEFDASSTGDQTIEVAIYRQNAQGDFTVELTPTIPFRKTLPNSSTSRKRPNSRTASTP